MENLRAHKDKLLQWAAEFPYCVILDSCGSENDRYGWFDLLIAVGGENTPHVETWEGFQQASKMHLARRWFGLFSYDLKNSFEEKLHTQQAPFVNFPELGFFLPDLVIGFRKGKDIPEMQGEWKEDYYEQIMVQKVCAPEVSAFYGFQSNFTQSEYEGTIEKLRNHIRDGDCYEVNLSQNFRGTAKLGNPVALWQELTSISPTPFAGFIRFGEKYLLCASPERFLQLDEGFLIAQPIKGTAPRGESPQTDLEEADRLRSSIKEQAENVMIVDLLRNDLYKSSVVDGVKVPHLFEVQSFPKVHHLVSTVMARKRPEVSAFEAFKNAFPPGSMTGAPKFRTCELIDQYEGLGRGAYSGAFGYFNPGGDFDLNVIIRSLVYDASTQKISYHVGGAITWDSDPTAEWEETLVKARAIRELMERFENGEENNQ